jgi:DNA-binding response OmpR family regulator
MKILFLEDDPGIGRVVSRGLAAEGYDVRWVRTVADATAALQGSPFATIILDLGLPDGDGLDLSRRLRKSDVETPILVLTAREALADKLDGFRAGADDYLSKPFAFEELLARLNVLVRRGQTLQAQIVSLGPLRLDLRSRKAECWGADLALTSREFELLAYLAQRPGEIFSRQALLDSVWGDQTQLTENTVDVYVGYLRRHLPNRRGVPRIETARGQGFRLAVDPPGGRRPGAAEDGEA